MIALAFPGKGSVGREAGYGDAIGKRQGFHGTHNGMVAIVTWGTDKEEAIDFGGDINGPLRSHHITVVASRGGCPESVEHPPEFFLFFKDIDKEVRGHRIIIKSIQGFG